jgi:hypothetical protein
MSERWNVFCGGYYVGFVVAAGRHAAVRVALATYGPIYGGALHITTACPGH